MAEATGLRHNALPYPVYGAPFGVAFPILDSDGDLVTGAAGLDSEISKNGDTAADCTNEATEIATSTGTYYLLLTGTEMTADVVVIRVKTSTTDAKTTVLVLYPRKLVSIRTGTSASAGSLTSTIVLDASASAVDDFYNGMVCVAVIDTLTEVRLITDYTGSTQSAAVTPDWNVAPDNNDTFTVYLPEGWQLHQANLTQIAGVTVSTSTAQLGVNVVNLAGSAIDQSGGLINANVKQISTDATAADNAESFFDGTGYAGTNNVIPLVTTTSTATAVTTVNGLANNVITAASINADAITDAKVAADVTIASVTGAVGSVTGAVGSVTGNVGGNVVGTVASVVGAVGSVTGNVGGNVTGSVGSVATGGIAAASFAAGAIDAAAIAANAIGSSELATTAVDEIADGVWDEATSGHTTAATYGNKLGAHIAAVGKLIVDAGSSTTVVFKTVDGAAASAVDDFYNNRVIVFTSGALALQACQITDYVGATVTATVTTMTGTPADTVTGVIV